MPIASIIKATSLDKFTHKFLLSRLYSGKNILTVKQNPQIKIILLIFDKEAITEETSIEQITVIEDVVATERM